MDLVGAPRHAAPRGENTDISALRVLVVDDDPDFREVMSRLLETRGAQVLCASGGRRGLAQVRRHDPDVVLLDQVMPDIEGLDVARTMRERGARAAIVIVSGWRGTQDLADGADVDALLLKPFSVDELMRTVTRALEHRTDHGGH